MSQVHYDINAAIASEVATGPDMTKETAGGASLPVEGPAKLRLVEYLETGKQKKKFKGADKVIDEVQLVFELSGKNYPPREFDGKKFPVRIITKFNKSMNAKAGFFKLFQVMNYQGKATHMAQLLGQAFMGVVAHYKSESMTSAMAVLNEIKAPRTFDAEREEYVPINVDAALSPLKVFFWNNPSKPMWDALFIDGQYEAEEAKDGKPARPAKSKNVVQNRIKTAENFKDSPLALLLLSNGVPLDIPAVGADDEDGPDDGDTPAVTRAAVPTGTAATDALSGIVG